MNDPSQPMGSTPIASAKSPAGIADAVRDQANGYVDRRKGEAASFLADLAKALRGGTGDLAEGAQVKSFMHTVADGLDDLSSSIDRHGLGDLYRDARAAASRNPTTSIVLAVIAGYGIFHLMRGSETAAPEAEPSVEPWGGYP